MWGCFPKLLRTPHSALETKVLPQPPGEGIGKGQEAPYLQPWGLVEGTAP